MRTQGIESCVICRAPLGQHSSRRTCQNAACIFAYQQHLRAGRATCTECGRPLSAVEESRGARVCSRVQCQTDSRLNCGIADSQRCGICRMRLTPDCLPDGVCRDRDCRDIHGWRQQSKLTSQRHEEFVGQTKLATVVRDSEAAANGIAAPQEYFVTVVSLFPNQLAVLPAERRQAFRDRLGQLISELGNESSAQLHRIEEAPANEAASSAVDGNQAALGADGERLAGAVCAACGGFCCRNGDTHAYLRVETLRRLLWERPVLGIEQIADRYLDCLPEQSFENSCVFHGERGCTLSREMRSDTCNAHYCAGQHSLRAALRDGTPPKAFVAIADGTEILAGRFVNANADA